MPLFFSKRGRSQGRAALVALRRVRNILGVSFLRTFFFAPAVSKKKVAKEFRLFKDRRTQFAPTVEQGEHVDCERKFVRFRVVEFSLRLGHAPVLTPHRGVIHYARAALLRRPLQSIRLRCQKEKWLRSFACFRAGDQWSPLLRDLQSLKLDCHKNRYK